MMKMQKVDRVQVKAGVPTELKPGSYHIMMTDMPETLPIGTEITVTAVFEKAGPVTFKATVTENSMPDMGGGMMSEESDDMMSGEMND
jgi:copper(I)-binding protein